MDHWTKTILGSIREIIFGLEDGLVSTLGVITGIAEGTHDRYVILLSGVVIVLVESLSMGAGTYLSNKSEQQMHFLKKTKLTPHQLIHRLEKEEKKPMRDAVFMVISYVIGGSIPVLPYLFLSLRGAILTSVIVTIGMLFLIGVEKGRLTNTDPLKSGIEMATVSFSAGALGFVIGKLTSLVFPQVRL